MKRNACEQTKKLTISRAGEIDVAHADLAQSPLQHTRQLGTPRSGALVSLLLVAVAVEQRAQSDFCT